MVLFQSRHFARQYEGKCVLWDDNNVDGWGKDHPLYISKEEFDPEVCFETESAEEGTAQFSLLMQKTKQKKNPLILDLWMNFVVC